MPIVRMQLEMPEEAMKEVEELMKQCGVATKKEFFNSALTFLKWAIRETEKGHIIASVDEVNDKYTQVLLPVFASVKPKTRE